MAMCVEMMKCNDIKGDIYHRDCTIVEESYEIFDLRIYPVCNLPRAMRKQERADERKAIEIKRTRYPFVQSIETANYTNQTSVAEWWRMIAITCRYILAAENGLGVFLRSYL
jgi:hypothetical protein